MSKPSQPNPIPSDKPISSDTLDEAFARIRQLTELLESAQATGRINIKVIANIATELEQLAERVARLERRGVRRKPK